MARLTKNTVQKLAVLRAVQCWSNGPYGSFRVHKTLYSADRNASVEARPRHIFTFKKWHHGQYSEEIKESLNQLLSAGRVHVSFDGPSERIVSDLNADQRNELSQVLDHAFPAWSKSLKKSIQEVGYLTNPEIKNFAKSDPAYALSELGQTIFESQLPDVIDLPDLDENTAERLSDLVDSKLSQLIEERFRLALSRPFEATDWEQELFGMNSDQLDQYIAS